MAWERSRMYSLKLLTDTLTVAWFLLRYPMSLMRNDVPYGSWTVSWSNVGRSISRPAKKLLDTAGEVPKRYRTSHPYRDRKSTRLNSSHLVISYAVFCLKKKT